jgi:hypothetical protein
MLLSPSFLCDLCGEILQQPNHKNSNGLHSNSLFPFFGARVYQCRIMRSFSAQGHPDHDSCAEEERLLRRILSKHCLMTSSPRAAGLLNSSEHLPMVRLQPRQLPCTVEQTWAPLMQRLGSPPLGRRQRSPRFRHAAAVVQHALVNSHHTADNDLDTPVSGR